MKKGISPLIATVLIIGFTIAIAGIVTSFLLNSSKDIKFEKFMEDNEFCDQVAISITEADCSGGINCPITLKNKGSFNIYGVIIHSDTVNTEAMPYFSDDETISDNEILKPGKILKDGATGDGIDQAYSLPKEKVTLTPIIKNPEYDGDFDVNNKESQILCTRSTSTIDLTQIS